MKLSCPACGAAFSLDVLIGHEGARDAVMVALKLPAPIGKLLIQYVALFRPPKRNLSMDRLATLLNDLQPLIEAAAVERSGRIWSAPLDYWHMALAEMVNKRDKLTLPLKGHGYLLAIIAGYGDKAEAGAEAQTEDRKAGRTPEGGTDRYHAPRGNAAERETPATTTRNACPGTGRSVGAIAKPRAPMPPTVKAALRPRAPEEASGPKEDNDAE